VNLASTESRRSRAAGKQRRRVTTVTFGGKNGKTKRVLSGLYGEVKNSTARAPARKKLLASLGDAAARS
jgi:hypothetical protein